MDLADVRLKLLTVVMDVVEVFSGEELVTVVTRDETGVLTPWVFGAQDELLTDQLNGWMDNTPWNAPKSL